MLWDFPVHPFYPSSGSSIIRYFPGNLKAAETFLPLKEEKARSVNASGFLMYYGKGRLSNAFFSDRQNGYSTHCYEHNQNHQRQAVAGERGILIRVAAAGG